MQKVCSFSAVKFWCTMTISYGIVLKKTIKKHLYGILQVNNIKTWFKNLFCHIKSHAFYYIMCNILLFGYSIYIIRKSKITLSKYK